MLQWSVSRGGNYEYTRVCWFDMPVKYHNYICSHYLYIWYTLLRDNYFLKFCVRKFVLYVQTLNYRYVFVRCLHDIKCTSSSNIFCCHPCACLRTPTTTSESCEWHTARCCHGLLLLVLSPRHRPSRMETLGTSRWRMVVFEASKDTLP